MKAKHAIIPFVPVVLVMLFFKLMSLFGLDSNGTFMGMSKMNITYLVIGLALGLFVICILINLFDRKTAPVYPVRKNPLAGVFAVLTGFSMMAASITTASNTWMFDFENKERLILAIVCAVFSVPAGLSFALISRVHFTGKNDVSGLSVLYVFPSLWGCAELVDEFLQATKASIYAKDATALFCFIFLSLYFFSNSMVVSRIKGRNPVKGLFIYGLPMAALTLTFGTYELFRMFREGFDRADLFFAVFFVSAAVYALSFLVEVFSNYYTKDDFEVVSSLEEGEEEGDFFDDSVKAEEKAEYDAENEAEYDAEAEDAAFAEDEEDEEVEPEGVGDLVFSETDAAEEAYGDVDPDGLVFTKEPVPEGVYINNDIEDMVLDGPQAPEMSYEDIDTDDLVFAQEPDEPEAPYEDADIDDLVYSDIVASDSQQDNVTEYYSAEKGMHDYIMGYDYETYEEPEADEKANLFRKNNKKKDKKPAKRPAAAKKPVAKDEIKEQLKATRREEKAGVRAQAAARTGKQSVEAALAASLKKKAAAPDASKQTSSNVQKLTEELKKAAESRKKANNLSDSAARVNEREIRGEIADAAKADAKKAEEERLALQIKKVEAARRAAAQKAVEAKKADAAKRAAEEAKKAEAAKRAAEEAKKAEAAKRAAEEAKKAEVAKHAAEEAKKAEAAKRAAEEAKKAEAAKRAAEAKKAEVAKRAAEEAKKAEAAKRAAEEAKKAEAAKRAAAAKRAEAEKLARQQKATGAQNKADAIQQAVQARRMEEQRRAAAAQSAQQSRSEAENIIAQGEETYRAKLSRADELLKMLGDKK